MRSTAEAPKVTLVRDEKRLEMRHLGFAACSIRQGAFAGLKSLDAPEPSFGSRAGQTQASALTPLRSMTFSNFSDGPLGRFSPISHFCTVDTLVLRTAANTA